MNPESTTPETAELEIELANLLNKHSAENLSGTPDFILAGYLAGCLENWNHWTKQRSYWTGEEQRPSVSP